MTIRKISFDFYIGVYIIIKLIHSDINSIMIIPHPHQRPLSIRERAGVRAGVRAGQFGFMSLCIILNKYNN